MGEDSQTLYLYDSDTVRMHGRAIRDEDGVQFPPDVDGWPDVMDCRCEPYTNNSIPENCDLAHHVRKPYILVTKRQHEQASNDPDEESDAD